MVVWRVTGFVFFSRELFLLELERKKENAFEIDKNKLEINSV